MSTTIPFTYYLYHKPTGKKYYGVRYRKGCAPSDLWTIYFSSSLLVKELISEYGTDSFFYEVRRTFRTVEEAKQWESKVQRRLQVSSRDEWLNRHEQSGKFRGVEQHTEETKRKIQKKMIGRIMTEEHKARISEKSLLDRERRRNEGWIMPRQAVERATQWKKDNHDTFYSPERNKKVSASKKGTKRVYLPDGSFVMRRPQEDQ